MAITIVSVSFSNGFIGDMTKTNESSNSSYLTALGWSNFQFQQATDSGQFGGSQGNDLSGTILITDAAGIQHAIDGVINWRAPSGSVSTLVFYATGTDTHVLATSGGGSMTIDPNTEANGDPHNFIGLTFNGQSLAIVDGTVSGNAATKGLLASLNEYLAGQPQLTVGDLSVNEDAGTATVTVSLSKASADTVTVRYTTQDGGALAGTDYTGSSDILVFSPNVTTMTITVPLTDNASADGARSFNIVLSDSTFAAIVDNTAVVTINDDEGAPAAPSEPPPTVTGVTAEDGGNAGATPLDSEAGEGAALVYTVTLSGSAGGEFALALGGSANSADLGAIAFSDGVAWKDGSTASGAVVVPAGVTGFTLTLPTIDDTLIEDIETAVLTVGGIAATGTIADNDTQSVSQVLAEDAAHTGAAPIDSAVVEGSSLLYTVNLSAASPSAVEHALTVSGSAGAADAEALVFSDGVGWKNGDAQTGIVVVPAGVGSFTVSVATVDDSEVESAEELVLGVGGVAATGSILDNDRTGVVSVLAEDAARAGALPVDSSVTEGGTLQYTVMLSAASATAEEFQLGLGGSAGGLDYGALALGDGATWKDGDPATGIVVVQAGVTSFRISVATTDDSAVELAESLAVTVGGVTGTGGITDNDSVSVASVIAEDAAQVGLSPVDSAVAEGGILRYTVQLSGAGVLASEFSLGFGGTANAADVADIVFSDGVDWKDGDAATGVVVVPAGVDSFKITVGTSDDDLIELPEALAITIGGVAATGTILDNDSQSVSSLKAEDAANPDALPVDSSVTEGGALLFSARLNGPSPTATEYTLALGGSASAADLGALSFSEGVSWKNGDPAGGAIVVAAGVAAFTVTLQTLDDSLVEAAESAVLSIGGVSATGTVTDNDSLAVSAVLAEDAANLGRDPHDSVVTEGASLLYSVTLNGAAPAATEFTLALSGTASGADLGALSFSHGVAWKNGDPASGIVVIPAGVAGFGVTLPTVDDGGVEASESAVLVVNGVHATGTLLDNDYVAPAPPVVIAPPEPQPQPQPEPQPQPQAPAPPPPVVVPDPVLETGLDPASDDGASNSDLVTGVRTPEFTLQGSQIAAGGSVRLLSPEGAVVGTSRITEADALAGRVNVGPGPLDDGVYTYTAQVMDASGKLVASAPVTVTVVTDLDGVMPSIELAAYGGDYNGDGILDWNQHSVALLPLRSLADFGLGKDAPVAAFGAILAGSLGTETGGVQLTPGAQLRDLGLSALPAALPEEARAASPVFKFTIEAEPEVPALPDLAPERPGLQTRVVIDLGLNGVVSNGFMKFDSASQSWYSFLDDQDLTTWDDGATLVDLNQDGRIDRIVLTLTDGARGDDDGVVNGTIVDPGLLVFDTTPNKVYGVRLNSGETYYTADLTDAQVHSTGPGNVFLGVSFDSMAELPDAKQVSAFFQPFTQDMTFAIDGQPLPYACYELLEGSPGFFAAAVGKAAVDIHLWQNGSGLTELASVAQARELGLAAQGYADRGARFSVDIDHAFRFDAEGYLIANQDNASVQALIKQLAGIYTSTSAAGFIEAVEQNYFEQIKLVGVAHGAAADAADLNTVFGTGFGN